MTGWQVLGWVIIADIGIVTTGLAAGLARVFWQSGDSRGSGTSIFKGKRHE